MNDIKKNRLIKLAKFLAIKLPIVFAVMAIMMIVSLKLVERYPDPLREGFQQYLSAAYNTNATIGKLEKITFFPTINVHATNVTMHNKSNAAKIDMEVKSTIISAPFWSMLLHAGRIKTLQVKGLQATAGSLLPYDLEIYDLNIIDKEGPEQYGSFIVAEGSYHGQKMTFEAEIQKLKSNYKISRDTPFSLKIGDVE
jgi:hypothetical protein